METNLPWAVDGKKFEYEFQRDASDNVVYDPEGAPVLDTSKPRYRGLDTTAIVATNTLAIQRLLAMLGAQQEALNAQQARIEALEAQLAGSGSA